MKTNKKTVDFSIDNFLLEEKQFLAGLSEQPRLHRWQGYWSKTGPGWMQSAMTIGGASAMASLFAGALLKYQLLWVQPVAIFLGIIMLSAVSYQTLMTGERPFYAMKKYAHPVIAWSWAIATLLSTVIWHFPQYALVSGMTEDIIIAITGWIPSNTQHQYLLAGLALFFLAIAIYVVWNYSKGSKGVARFELFLKVMIWLIIFCFLFIVIRNSLTDTINWSEVFKGFISFKIPTDKAGVTVMMAAFSATIGINMTFLFGYSYLKKGWGKEHYGLAKFDLITGMFIPFVLATALMVIATGATIYDPVKFAEGNTSISPIEVAGMLEASGMPLVFSRVIFGFGIVGMALNAIVLHMLVCGFAACEVFGWDMQGWKYRLACLIPIPGVLGVFFWDKIGPWVAVPASAICGLLLPIAYVGFLILNNSKRFLGENIPKGRKAWMWNFGMIMAIIISIVYGVYYLIKIL